MPEFNTDGIELNAHKLALLDCAQRDSGLLNGILGAIKSAKNVDFTADKTGGSALALFGLTNGDSEHGAAPQA